MDGILELIGEATNEFWRKCTSALENELSQYNEKRISLALSVISDYGLSAYIPKIKSLINSELSETLLYEIIEVLSKFKDLYGINKTEILDRISDYNLKASAAKLLV